MLYLFLFVLGTIVGSFLNVLALRWDEAASWRLPDRSKCPGCGKTLSWWELVPILSFIVLKAQCSGCRTKIFWQYPLVEFWSGLIFVSLYFALGLTPYFLLAILVFCIYTVILIYDFRHQIIPNALVYTSIILALLAALFFLPSPHSLLDWLAGPILFTFFAAIWFLSGGRAMGLGDAKLALSVGLLLGAAGGFSAIILAFWLGALGALLYWFTSQAGFIKKTKELTMKSEVPFAPAIVLGAWLSLVFEIDLLHVALF